MPLKARHSKLRPQVSFQGHSMPLEPPLQPIPYVTPISSSMPTPLGSTSQTIVPPIAPTQQPHLGREGSRVWTVQAIDEEGNIKKVQLTKQDVFDMPRGQRIIVPFDRLNRAFGEAATLLSSACGRVVTDSRNVPINFESWSKVPKSYKETCFGILKNLFHFEAAELIASRYCYLTMSTKYKNGKLDLWSKAYDPSLSREQLIANVPEGIHRDQWSSFVDNHLKAEYKELCRKNAKARKKQTIPHTGGSKLLSRKHHEMEVELGRPVGRGELYIATHKKKDGSYVNEEARSIGEKVAQEISQSANSSEINVNDVVAKVLGKDHPGCVRYLGLGGLQSVAFSSTTSFSGIGCSHSCSSSVESSQWKEEVISLRNKLAASEENVKTLQNVMLAYIKMKEGHIPTELESLFGITTDFGDEGSRQEMSTPHGGSLLASNRN